MQTAKKALSIFTKPRYMTGHDHQGFLKGVSVGGGGSMFTDPHRVRLLQLGKIKIGGVHKEVGGSLSSSQFVAQINNPAGSGVDLWIGKVYINTDQPQLFRFIDDAVLDTPEDDSAGIRNLNRSFPSDSVASLMFSEVVPTSGDPWPGRWQYSAGQHVISSEDGGPLMKLPPDSSVTIAGDSSNSQSTGVQIVFAEVPTV